MKLPKAQISCQRKLLLNIAKSQDRRKGVVDFKPLLLPMTILPVLLFIKQETINSRQKIAEKQTKEEKSWACLITVFENCLMFLKTMRAKKTERTHTFGSCFFFFVIDGLLHWCGPNAVGSLGALAWPLGGSWFVLPVPGMWACCFGFVCLPRAVGFCLVVLLVVPVCGCWDLLFSFVWLFVLVVPVCG